MRKLSILVALVAIACFAVVGLAYAAEPDMVTMNSKVYAKHTKPLVKFTHKKHAVDYKIDCKACHHTMKSKADAKACDSCHNVGKPSSQLSAQEKKMCASPELAYHANCKDQCHKKMNAAGKKAPVACGQCHAK